MSRSQGIRNGNANAHGFPPGNRPALDAAAQTLAFEQFGDYVGDPVVVSDVENRQYVGVRERGDSLGFALKARLCLAVVGQALGQNLDRDVSAQPGVECTKDLTHSARADGRDKLVRSESRAGRQRFLSRLADRRGSRAVEASAARVTGEPQIRFALPFFITQAGFLQEYASLARLPLYGRAG
jgi:hypothetical protein